MHGHLIPGCSFLWLFSGGYEALAFGHQRVTFCFPDDIGLSAVLFLAHNIFDAVQTSFFLLVYSLALLDCRWNTSYIVLLVVLLVVVLLLLEVTTATSSH